MGDRDVLRLLEAIVESSADAIVSARLDGTIETWNAGAERMFGVPRGDAIGSALTSVAPADKRDEITALFVRVQRGERITALETTRWRRDGTPVDVSLSISPITDEHGAIIGVSGIARDISERRRLERQLLVTGRMVSLGTLAAGIAHEINNPLAYVMANLELLARRPADRDLADSIAQALDGCDRIRRVVSHLRTFARTDEDHRAPLDLRAVLEIAIAMCFNELRHRARIVKDYSEVPPVDGDESRLTQVLINILLNASQALPEGRANEHEITIVCRRAGERVVVEIRDTGSGIPEAIRSRIFDPFFTTKPIGIGTGLGLAISQAIVASHGGEITFESEVGRGTTFRIALPVSTSAVAPRVAAAPIERPTRRRVLVVDDEPRIGTAVARMLGTECDVSIATNGREALERFTRAERFDAIVCDLMMPELTGMDLHAELSRIAPDQAAKMIFMTGGVFTPAGHAFLEAVPNPRLEKPFPMSTLQALVRALR